VPGPNDLKAKARAHLQALQRRPDGVKSLFHMKETFTPRNYVGLHGQENALVADLPEAVDGLLTQAAASR
jgi:hypothetical protein